MIYKWAVIKSDHKALFEQLALNFQRYFSKAVFSFSAKKLRGLFKQ